MPLSLSNLNHLQKLHYIIIIYISLAYEAGGTFLIGGGGGNGMFVPPPPTFNPTFLFYT